MDRRQFTKLTAAALGGMVAGTMVGCGGGDDKKGKAPGGDNKGSGAKGTDPKGGDEVAANDWTGDTHVCRGLNACMNKGASGDNACAGQGKCATAKAHSCHEDNDCKYQGGCGESVGQNACKGKGECAVPLGEGAWTKARASFETAMKGASKEFGDAPAKAEPAKKAPEKAPASKS